MRLGGWRRWGAVLGFVLAGCSSNHQLDAIASPEEQAAARSTIDQLRARNFAAVEPALDRSVFGAEPRALLEEMAAHLPAQAPSSVKLVGAHKHVFNGVERLNLSFEFQYERSWMVANVATETQAGRRTIIGFNLYPRTQSLEEENRFRLAGKSLVHYAVLAAAAAAVAISVAAAIACLRTRALRRRWAWALVSFLGLTQFALNWTTGQWRFSLVWFLLPPAGAVAPLYGPWIVTAALPVGAVIALVARARAVRRAVQAQ